MAFVAASRCIKPLVASGAWRALRPSVHASALHMKPRMLQLPMAFSTKREIRRLHVEDRFSEVVVHNGTVYLSGQLADDLDGGIAAQTAETLASIDQFLADAGTDKSRILSVTIYLKDMADYAGMNAVWDAWVVKGATPARATVQSALYDPKVLVEMSVVAAL